MQRQKLKDILGRRIIIGDGSTGAYMQQLTPGSFYPDELNLSRPDIVETVYKGYAAAGADFISTNTFGASRLKLRDMGLDKDFTAINRTSVRLARRTADAYHCWVAGNIGPCGRLPRPTGDTPFEDLMLNAAEQAGILQQEGADFLILETMTDIQEYRATLAGILSVAKIPVLATMSFTQEERTLSGTDGKTFAVTGAFPGLAALGINCVSSFQHLKTILSGIACFSPLPVICQPNAGLPTVINGKGVFSMTPETFADNMEEIVALGAAIIGSCCGSTPDFTRLLAERFKGRKVIERHPPSELTLSSRTAVHRVSRDKLFVIGERINPTGRKKLRGELEAGQFTMLRADAKAQIENGADALDININLGQTNRELLSDITDTLQTLAPVPLVIDSTDRDVIETFARRYAGKTIINSISGEQKSLEELLPLARKYHMAFIALLIDEEGVSATAAQRLAIAARIVKEAKKRAIPTTDIIFDPLVLSAGAEPEKAPVTLETLSLLKKKYPHNKTVMGVSNISFGLPNREPVNAAYLAMAAACGADIAIINPLQETMRAQVMMINFLRSGSREALHAFMRTAPTTAGNSARELSRETPTLRECILDGDAPGALKAIIPLLNSTPPDQIVSEFITPAMNEVGRRYQEKTFFLPQLMAAAEAVKAIMPVIRERLNKNGAAGEATRVVFASVKGDVHDIGKNIVMSILESFNYRVTDLGKDVSPDKVVRGAVEHGADIIGLSTLMTTTLAAMTETVRAIRATPELHHVQIFAGGAAVTPAIARDAGALYAADGMEMAHILNNLRGTATNENNR